MPAPSSRLVCIKLGALAWVPCTEPPAVMALAIEHVWAVNLVNAMKTTGAEVAINWRVPAEEVDAAFAARAAAGG